MRRQVDVSFNLEVECNVGQTHVVLQQQTRGLAGFLGRERENRGITVIQVGDISVKSAFHQGTQV